MIKSRSSAGFLPGSVLLVAGVSVLFLMPASGHAEQFILFDVTFTYTKADADNSRPSKSHYYVHGKDLNPDRPRDGRPQSIIAMERSTSGLRLSKSPKVASPRHGPFATFRIKAKRMATAARAPVYSAKKECTSAMCR